MNPSSSPSPTKLLVIDGSIPVRLWIKKTLSKEFCVLEASCAQEGLLLCEQARPSLILIDAQLPDHSGLALVRHLRASPSFCTTPIVVITADRDDTIVTEAFAAGCTDFIRKPLRPAEFVARIQMAMELKAADERIGRLILALKDRSEKDALTGLFNRLALHERGEREVAKATRDGSFLGLMMIDVDRFKEINDSGGHEAGDLLLKTMARSLHKQLRSYDIIARYGGDEFVVLLPNSTPEQALKTAQKFWKGWQQEVCAQNSTLSIGVSALQPQKGESAESTLKTLLRQGDEALYQAKGEGRNRVCLQNSSIERV